MRDRHLDVIVRLQPRSVHVLDFEAFSIGTDGHDLTERIRTVVQTLSSIYQSVVYLQPCVENRKNFFFMFNFNPY